MLKRLIEVALPLKEVSEQSAREKSIRDGHISTLHMWWARRPLAACRAVIFASLIPDPDDPECPEAFRTLVMDVLGRVEFRPTGLEPSPSAPTSAGGVRLDDTPRNRCLEFLKHLVRWENSNSPEYIEPARKLIAAAHQVLHSDRGSGPPRVVDPFAGGGAFPLEAIRLGCDAHAIDLNPVAHLIQLCTLVYPQTFGKSKSRPVPDYIKRLAAHSRATRKAKGETDLFEKDNSAFVIEDGEIIPAVAITSDEYQKNPLAADVKYWGHWVLSKAQDELRQFHPNDADGGIPVAYLWARTVKSPDPTTQADVPLISQLWLCKKAGRNVAVRINPDTKAGKCRFTIVENAEIDFDPNEGTVKRGDSVCPFTGTVIPSKYIKAEGHAGRLGQQLMCVVTVRPGESGKQYRAPTEEDETLFQNAAEMLSRQIEQYGDDVIPQELIPAEDSRAIFVHLYGLLKWGDLFNTRQALSLITLVRVVKEAIHAISAIHDEDYALAVGSYLGVGISRLANFNSTLCVFNHTGGRGVANTFGRQALRMSWNYAETAPFNPQGANWFASIDAAVQTILNMPLASPANVRRGSATKLPSEDSYFDAVVTDPAYYDAVPYAELSDFFYVWLRRTLGESHPNIFLTPLTPKAQELIAYRSPGRRKNQKTPAWYEAGMAEAFAEMHRVVNANGVVAVMFAHKATSAWVALIAALNKAGLVVTTSWPFHTERPGRIRAQASAALASSVTLICRRRIEDAGDGLWDDVRQELKTVAQERLDFFWDQGIRGADFFISAIGPALSVFGRYARVIRISGEEVTVGEFLDEVRALVTNYALMNILHTTNTSNIDPESRFYIVWKWSYGDAKVPADESFKLAQALGIDTEEMWDKTGVLTKSGENVQCLPVEKRMKVKDLGEPEADGTPSSLINVLHRMCVFRDKGDNAGMAQFLGRSGQARNGALWLIAQAVSEILPDGEREKQLMQGLLNQQEGLEEATRQGELF